MFLRGCALFRRGVFLRCENLGGQVCDFGVFGFFAVSQIRGLPDDLQIG